eukprot:3528517-Amphidinium_carterae.1
MLECAPTDKGCTARCLHQVPSPRVLAKVIPNLCSWVSKSKKSFETLESRHTAIGISKDVVIWIRHDRCDGSDDNIEGKANRQILARFLLAVPQDELHPRRIQTV